MILFQVYMLAETLSVPGYHLAVSRAAYRGGPEGTYVSAPREVGPAGSRQHPELVPPVSRAFGADGRGAY